ncbi:MAG TPA: glycosyltransferase family 9 protein [Stellaceae bacterium]|nr:glycosyltransferase family 9 protein [Stellaceae bacterium]
MRILFVTATRIGDAVLSTGLLSHLVECNPQARFTIAAGPIAAPLFEAVPRLDRLIVVDKRRFGLHWLGLLRRVVGWRWGLVVDLRGSALAYLLWSRERLIGGKGDLSVNRVREIGEMAGLDPPPAPRLWTAPRHESAAAALAPPGAPLLAIAPAANWRAKTWRSERFAELARRLTAPEGPLPLARVAVLAAAHEREQSAPVLAAIPEPRRIDLVGNVDLLTAAAVLRRAALFVGNDTGLMHIAAAMGAPTLGLFGPSPVERFAPWGARAGVVQTPLAPRELMGAPDFDYRTTDTLMDGLTVDAVEAGARALVQRVAGAAA